MGRTDIPNAYKSVDWLGDEHAKQEVEGSSAGGREVRIFRAKNCMTYDYPTGFLLLLKKILFFSCFLCFLKTTSLSLLEPALISPLITVSTVVPVKKTSTDDGVFEPAVI